MPLSKPKERKFRWDPHHKQPHTDLSKWEKLWESRFDLWPFAKLLGRSFRGAPGIVWRYEGMRQPEYGWHEMTATNLAIAFSPTTETWDRHVALLEELGARSILLRVLCWDRERLFNVLPQVQVLRNQGYDLTIAMLQDRESVLNGERWSEFVRETCERVVQLKPKLEVGHAFNRKKWGIWHPDEYLRMLDAMAPIHEGYRDITWLGPAFIDFEYYYLVHVLYSGLPFTFDGISSHLYVDRRGGPDAFQYGRFDTWEKLVLWRAVVDASTHPNVPLHISEFNWCLKDTGKYSSAGGDVQVAEEEQAAFLSIYFMTVAASGMVESCVWWELVANGFGLIHEDDQRKRPAWDAYATLLRETVGWQVRRLPPQEGGFRGFALRKDERLRLYLYQAEGEARLRVPGKGTAFSFLGQEVDARDGWHTLSGSPIFMEVSEDEASEVLNHLGISPTAIARS